MLKKIFKFVVGYVIIKVTGKNRERFINMCLYNGLDIYDVSPIDEGLVFKTDKKSFIAMRRLVRKSGVRLKITGKRGLRYVLYRYRRRWGFAVSGVLVCIFFLLLPQYILCIEIDGTYSADRAEIEKVLREHGVYIGAKKSGIDDLGEIKNAVIYGVDGINWAWLYDEGARMRLRVQESVPAPQVRDKTIPTDIIASHDGWITRADIYRGEGYVHPGMAVSAGDLLVSGKVAVYPEGEPEDYLYVHSDAVIKADTIRKETGVFSSKEELRIKTGSTKHRVAFELFGKRLDMFLRLDCGFGAYDTTEHIYDLDTPLGYSGISCVVYDVDEVNVTERELSEAEVLDRAREQLEEKICKSLGTGAVKEREELHFTKNNGIYTVELKMYLKENIGIEVPMKQE